MKIIIIRILICVNIVGFSSCYVSKEINENFKYCYNGIDITTKEKLNLNGYHKIYYKTQYKDAIQKLNSFNCLFLKEGFFIYHFNPETYNGHYGRYVIENDTIKAEYIYEPQSSVIDVWFEIIDSNSIKWLLSKSQTPITKKDIEKFHKKYPDYLVGTSKFIALDTLPNPDRFIIKRKKFYWCNDEKYREFMTKVKREKIKKYNDFKAR